MASLSTAADGARRVQFTGPDRKRRTLRLGKTPKKTAEQVKGMVERLLTARIAGHAPDDHTARWVAGLDAVMHDRLAAVGLVTPRASATVAEFAADYVADRTDLKDATRTHLLRAADGLAAFFGPAAPLRDVTAADGDRYRRSLLAAGRGENTVRREVGRAKQIFNAAVRAELLDRNPFADQKVQVRGNPDKFRFVTRGEIDRVLAVCPDGEWRRIVVLARYGGLRVVSELVPLTWGDVDLEAGKLHVTSPKTAHHEGGGSRVVPLFPELRERLDPAGRDPAAQVVPRAAGGGTNLGTQFKRIVRAAGLEPWPKPFHNLRATRQTELANEFPEHVVCEWIGNTAAVAREHYLRVTDAHFDRAAAPPAGSDARGAGDQGPAQPNADAPEDACVVGGDAESDARATHFPTPQGAASGGTDRHDPPQPPPPGSFTPPSAAGSRLLQPEMNPRPGFEPGLTEPKSVVLPLHHRGAGRGSRGGTGGRGHGTSGRRGRQDAPPDTAARRPVHPARRGDTVAAWPPRSPRSPRRPCPPSPCRPRTAVPACDWRRCGRPNCSPTGRCGPRAGRG